MFRADENDVVIVGKGQHGTHLTFWCPFCGCLHTCRVYTGEWDFLDFDGPGWHWNGDTQRPTLEKGIVRDGNRVTSYSTIDGHRCHTWMNSGEIRSPGNNFRQMTPVKDWPLRKSDKPKPLQIGDVCD